MNRPSVPAHIARLSVLSVAGLLITYACGVRTTGSMMIYCAFLELYARTIKASRVTVLQRLRIQFIGVPITLSIHLLLSFIPGLPAVVRLPLGAAIAVPLLLTLNYKLKLGMTEISQLVIVALLTTTFETNRMYFAYRLFFTTLGILLSYISFVWVFPVRYDQAYERSMSAFRRSVSALCAQLHGLGWPEETQRELRRAAACRGEAASYLAILRDDLHLKRQYRPYIGRMAWEEWEHTVLSAFLDLAGCLSRTAALTEYAQYVRHTAAAVWNQLGAPDETEGFSPPTLLSLEPVRYLHIKTPHDAELAHLLGVLHAAVCACPEPALARLPSEPPAEAVEEEADA